MKKPKKKLQKKSRLKRILLWIGGALALLALALVLLARKPVPERFTYGISFSAPYTEELGLNAREVYTAFLAELGVRHLRLAAQWPMIEPRRDAFDFSELDFEVAEAKKYGADIVLAVGRRLPRWPECHTPGWAQELSWEEQKNEIKAYVTEVINRYKDEPHIVYWQVENEPYLGTFARDQCGELDEAFLKEEIALVRELDPGRPILVTDGGNFGTWTGAYGAGDAFGTSVYVYFWNPTYGQFRTVLPSVTYRIKENLVQLFYGTKPTFLIELSLEPWLIEPVIKVPIETQLERMNPEKFDEIIQYAKETRYDRQYLWGGEWWYWLKTKGRAEMWEKGAAIFAQ
ncbi:beta-galactosidase [Candidatus Kaiserbacteria bacterium]|nr:beta-galactosidase [Candidatus Kaiserbacteria bacterium]